jgi:hypothetical protein
MATSEAPPAPSLPARPSRISSLGTLEFSALVLAILVAAAWLGVRGIESHADLRQRRRFAELRMEATSPAVYRKLVPVTRRVLLGTSVPGGTAPLLVLRADSFSGPAEREHLCTLARESTSFTGAEVRWVALSGDVPPCARAVVAGAAAPGAGDAAAIRREIRSARWVLVDAGSRVLFNARGVPSPSEVRGTLALLRPSPESPAEPSR